MKLPLLLIHGYSDVGDSFKKWKQELVKRGLYKENEIHICNYRTLTNEVTIKDIAEGFDRALRIHKSIGPEQEFDAIVHSTGMLVLRSWLSAYGQGRMQRVKRLIALAPASFGSPLAHKGRSWIGAIFKGNREKGPDFMEAGNLVLDGLELASRFTWDLAHRDLLDHHVFYGPDTDTPYVFTFCGNKAYSGLKGLVTASPGTDGTVRWAGCSLNSRKIMLDFTKPPGDKDRIHITKWPTDTRTNLGMSMIPVKNLNHASIIENPSEELIEMVAEALDVNSYDSYKSWLEKAVNRTSDTFGAMDKWQQFVVHARDERGDPITDFNLQLYKLNNGMDPALEENWKPVDIDVHAYKANTSYRCFHVNLKDIMGVDIQKLKMEFMASTGTELLGYLDHVNDDTNITALMEGQPTFEMDLTPLATDTEIQFFYPFTTTLIEVVLNREPLPLRDINKVTQFLEE